MFIKYNIFRGLPHLVFNKKHLDKSCKLVKSAKIYYEIMIKVLLVVRYKYNKKGKVAGLLIFQG